MSTDQADMSLFCEFLTQEGWGSLSLDGWALFRNYDTGQWWLHTPQHPHHEITETAARILLEQYDMPELPES